MGQLVEISLKNLPKSWCMPTVLEISILLVDFFIMIKWL